MSLLSLSFKNHRNFTSLTPLPGGRLTAKKCLSLCHLSPNTSLKRSSMMREEAKLVMLSFPHSPITIPSGLLITCFQKTKDKSFYMTPSQLLSFSLYVRFPESPMARPCCLSVDQTLSVGQMLSPSCFGQRQQVPWLQQGPLLLLRRPCCP